MGLIYLRCNVHVLHALDWRHPWWYTITLIYIGFENFPLHTGFRIKWYIFSMSITMCFHDNTDSCLHFTSVTINSKNVHKDVMFGWQGILQFSTGVFKDFKYVKFQKNRIVTLKMINVVFWGSRFNCSFGRLYCCN